MKYEFYQSARAGICGRADVRCVRGWPEWLL